MCSWLFLEVVGGGCLVPVGRPVGRGSHDIRSEVLEVIAAVTELLGDDADSDICTEALIRCNRIKVRTQAEIANLKHDADPDYQEWQRQEYRRRAAAVLASRRAGDGVQS